MPNPDLIRQEANIVLIGSFNPLIFHPDWIFRHGLMPAVETEKTKIEIIHPDICKFSLAWVDIEVIQHRFIARTNDPSQYSPLRDLIISIFQILSQTPMTQLGINKNKDFSFLDDEEAWHKIGDVLAPKNIWNMVLPKRVGLQTLRVKSPRNDNLPGNTNVAVEPSSATKYGVNININSHVDLEDGLDLTTILNDYWDNIHTEMDAIAQTILIEALK